MEKEITVPQASAGARLDYFLSANIQSISRTKIHDRIKDGQITVDGKVKKPSYHLKGGEKVFIKTAEVESELEPFKFDIPIIYEDNDIIVVDKPGGLVVHPPQINCRAALVNALIYMKKELSTINLLRRGVVHRLDKETSGVMVLAKNNDAHLNLIKQFKDRKVKKEYAALCWGNIKQERLVIDLPLKRDEKNRLKMKISFTKAKNAYTQVEVLNRFTDAVFLKLTPRTGRMHQIRVHLKFLGCPIVGDKKYGIKDNYADLLLHSCCLGFYHPREGNLREFTSTLPERFAAFINKYK